MLVGLTIPPDGAEPHVSTRFLRTEAFEGARASEIPKYPEFGTPRRGGGGWWGARRSLESASAA